jgi:uncharacterized paraquat-inducible protein A
MIKCGGCGRDIDPTGITTGNKYLCLRCLHTQTAGQEPLHARSNIAFVAIGLSALVVIALAGLAICLLYLSGTGKTAWFILFLVLVLCAVLLPAILMLKRRNLALLIAALYVPFGIWSLLFYFAPGVHWAFNKVTSWGAICFLGIGLFSLYIFLRDKRTLPRL